MKTIKTTLKKVHWNDVDFSPIKITSKKVHRKNGDFRPIDITSKKVRRNDMDISQIKITSKSYVKISSSFCSLISCGTKYVETTWFFPIEITSKKYVEATWKYDDIFFSTYRRNIDIEWMLITRVALVGFAEIFVTVDRRKAISLISGQHSCQRFSPFPNLQYPASRIWTFVEPRSRSCWMTLYITNDHFAGVPQIRKLQRNAMWKECNIKIVQLEKSII